MRGSPLLRALILFLALAAFAVPLWFLTRPAGPTNPLPTDATTAPVEPLEIQAAFLPGAPVEFEVRHLGRLVWRGAGAEQGASGPLALPFPEEGIELQVRVRWSSGVPNGAVRLQVLRRGAPALERVAWSGADGSIDAVLNFP